MTSLAMTAKGGRLLLDVEALRLRDVVGMPNDVLKLLTSNALVGGEVVLLPRDDLSGFGVEMQWFDPDQVISEALETYPGLLALKYGYYPIGMCLEGSGDPYFYRGSDGAVVRIPHEAAAGGDLDESQIDLVANSLAALC